MEQSTVNINTLRENGELDLGILIDGVVHRTFTVRPATLADTYRAAEVVPVPVNTDDSKAAMIAYQMAVDDAQTLCQLVSLGSLSPLPSPPEIAAQIDPDDMTILRQATARVKKKWRESRRSLPPTGEPNTSSSAPVMP